ncbi:replication endonuclease [Fodinicurvata fenggangensis]|uniref:replication endonuclease n=1 Tax=Fodinicurvata fenggangensis TaxID=1121830 RepID=UPI000479E837|nr:replication endonuclease [Fodinicurvata fenggangensis]
MAWLQEQREHEEKGLRLFQCLPRAWQRTLLRRHGGTGDEEPDDLHLALIPPEPDPKAAFAEELENRAIYRRDYGHMATWTRWMRPPNDAPLPYTYNERQWMEEKSGQEALDRFQAIEADHYRLADLKPLARSISNACQGLEHVPRDTIRLLASTDEELLEEATRITEGREAVHVAWLARRRQDFARRQKVNEGLRRAHQDITSTRRILGMGLVFIQEANVPNHAFSARKQKAAVKKIRRRLKGARKKAAQGGGIHKRERDAKSCRRRLRRKIGKSAAWAAGILGLVGGPPRKRLPAYADNWQLRRWREVQEKGQAFLETHEIYRNVGGEETAVSLAEVAASAARGREARWYAVINGMQEQGERRGLLPLFVTLTLPSKFHLHAESGKRGDPSISPSMAAKEINRRWHWIMAWMRQAGNSPFGARVIEPQRDGTPHLHACIWIREEMHDEFLNAIDRHFPTTIEKEKAARSAVDENKNEKPRDFSAGPAAVVRVVDPSLSSPTTYIMKYVLKSLRSNSAPESEDDPGHERAAAWASHIGARRISLVGLRPGTLALWQTVQRLARQVEDEESTRDIDSEIPRIRSILHAWKKRQWGTVLVLLGGLSEHPRLLPRRGERRSTWGDTVYTTTHYVHPQATPYEFVTVDGEIKVKHTRPVTLVVREEVWTIREVSGQGHNTLKTNPLSNVISSSSCGADAPPGDHEHPPDGHDPPDSGSPQTPITALLETAGDAEVPPRVPARLQQQADAIDEAIAAAGLQALLTPAPPSQAEHTSLQESERARCIVNKLRETGKMHRLRGTRLSWMADTT